MKRCAVFFVLLAAGGIVPAQAQQGPTTAPLGGPGPAAASAPSAAPAPAAAPAAAPGQCPVSGATTAPLGGPRPAADKLGQCPVSGATTAPSAGRPMSAEMAQMLGLSSPAGGATTWPAASSASISIQAVQGTKDGPKITGGKATIRLYRGQGIEPEVLEANLDEHGAALLEKLSLARPFQPVVTIEHAGVSYEAVGEAMTPDQPTQKIEVRVYETTNKRPDIKIPMRHVVAIARPEGLRVMDMMIVNNPAERSWTGAVGPDGKTAAVSVGLPAGARDIEMDGAFEPCCASVINGRLVSSAPLVPGQSQYRVAYLVPGAAGLANIDIDVPLATGMMIVLVPEDQSGNVKVEGLAKGDASPANGNGMMMRAFTGRDVAPGQKISLTITGMPEAASAESAPWSTPQIVGIFGGGLILVLCAAFLLAKPGRKPAQAEAKASRAKGA